MSSDPQYTIVGCFTSDGNSHIIEIEDTPLETELKATFDGGTPATVVLGVLLFAVANLLPDSSAKYHAWKAYHALLRERVSIEDRIGATEQDKSDELPF